MDNTIKKAFQIDDLKVQSRGDTFEFNEVLFLNIYDKSKSSKHNILGVEFGQNNINFGFEFAKKIVDHVTSLVDDKSLSLKESSSLLIRGLHYLDDEHRFYGFDLYRKKLEQAGDPTIARDGKLTAEAEEQIVLGRKQLQLDHDKAIQVMTEVFATLPQFQNKSETAPDKQQTLDSIHKMRDSGLKDTPDNKVKIS